MANETKWVNDPKNPGKMIAVDANAPAISSMFSQQLGPPAIPGDDIQGEIPPPPTDMPMDSGVDLSKFNFDQKPAAPGFWSAFKDALPNKGELPTKADVGGFIGGIPGRVGNALKENFAQAPVGPGVNIVSKLLFGKSGDIYNNDMMNPQPQAASKESDKGDWFNTQAPVAGSGGGGAMISDIASFDRSPIGIKLQTLQRMGNPNPAQLATMKSLQELRSAALANEKTGLDLAKAGRERTSDIGSYTQGTDDYKDLVNKSNTLKKMDSVVQDLEIAKNKGDVKSVGAIGTELIGFLNKVQGQMVTQEQRETLNPLIQKVHGLFGLGAGETINPSNYPVMLNTIKAIRSELQNDLASYVEKPGANIPEDKKSWLYNNEIKPSGEKIDAPKISIGGRDFAGGIDKDGNNVVIDPKTNIPYALDKDGKSIAGILMKSGELAVPKDGSLTYLDGSPIDHSKDRYATVIPLSPEYVDYNKFGFPKPNKTNSVKVDRLSPNADTFDIVYNKSQRGDDLEGEALKRMNAMNTVNTKAEGAQEAQRIGNIAGGIGQATKDVPIVGPILSGIGSKLGEVAAAGAPNYQDEMRKLLGIKGSTSKTKSSDSNKHYEMKKIDGKWQKVEVK